MQTRLGGGADELVPSESTPCHFRLPGLHAAQEHKASRPGTMPSTHHQSHQSLPDVGTLLVRLLAMESGSERIPVVQVAARTLAAVGAEPDPRHGSGLGLGLRLGLPGGSLGSRPQGGMPSSGGLRVTAVPTALMDVVRPASMQAGAGAVASDGEGGSAFHVNGEADLRMLRTVSSRLRRELGVDDLLGESSTTVAFLSAMIVWSASRLGLPMEPSVLGRLLSTMRHGGEAVQAACARSKIDGGGSNDGKTSEEDGLLQWVKLRDAATASVVEAMVGSGVGVVGAEAWGDVFWLAREAGVCGEDAGGLVELCLAGG